MIHQIEHWIDQTNSEYKSQRQCCSIFKDHFTGFYNDQFLSESYFVLVDEIPKPNFQELREAGFSDFIDMAVEGITYKNTYYIKPNQRNNLRLHFHELVHVAQWQVLGVVGFIQRYMNEILTFGYDRSPLEEMAYGFDEHFSNNGAKIDVLNYVSKKI